MTNISKKPPDFTRTGSIQWDSSWPELAEENERHRLFSYLENRFGISEKTFDDYLLFRRKKSWSVMKIGAHVTAAAQLKVSRVGMKAFQKVGAYIKPTTRLIQAFGHTATKARLFLDEAQLFRLLNSNELPMNLDLEKGYVIISLNNGIILGVGFYGHGTLKSQIPRKEFRKTMLKPSPHSSV